MVKIYNIFFLIIFSGNFSSSEHQNLSNIEKMKIAITDEYIQIEGKNKDRINGQNNCSFFFATNRPHGVVLGESDRRFNVAPWQTEKIHNTKWWPGYNELVIRVQGELQQFVWYLKQHEVDECKIGHVISNEPKKLLQIMSQSNADQFFEAVMKGDVNWLRDHLAQTGELDKHELLFDAQQFLNRSKGNKAVSVSELCMLYNALTRKRLATVAFGKLAAAYLGKSKIVGKRPNRFRGWYIKWKLDTVNQQKTTDGNSEVLPRKPLILI